MAGQSDTNLKGCSNLIGGRGMFKDRMQGASVTKGAIIVGGNAYVFFRCKQRKEIGLLHGTVQEKGSQDSGGSVAS